MPTCEPPPAVYGHVPVGLGETALSVLATGLALVIGRGVDETEPLSLHGYTPER